MALSPDKLIFPILAYGIDACPKTNELGRKCHGISANIIVEYSVTNFQTRLISHSEKPVIFQTCATCYYLQWLDRTIIIRVDYFLKIVSLFEKRVNIVTRAIGGDKAGL